MAALDGKNGQAWILVGLGRVRLPIRRRRLRELKIHKNGKGIKFG